MYLQLFFLFKPLLIYCVGRSIHFFQSVWQINTSAMLRLIKATSSVLCAPTSRSLRARAVRVFNTRISNAATRSRSFCSDKRSEHVHDHKCNHGSHIHDTNISTQHPVLAQTLDQDLRKHRYVHFYTYKGLKNMNLVRKTKRQFIEEWGKLGVLGR